VASGLHARLQRDRLTAAYARTVTDDRVEIGRHEETCGRNSLTEVSNS